MRETFTSGLPSGISSAAASPRRLGQPRSSDPVELEAQPLGVDCVGLEALEACTASVIHSAGAPGTSRSPPPLNTPGPPTAPVPPARYPRDAQSPLGLGRDPVPGWRPRSDRSYASLHLPVERLTARTPRAPAL